MWTHSDRRICARAERTLGIALIRSELSWNGLHNRSYWYVDQPSQGVYIVALTLNREIVLLDHYRAPFDDYFWEVPAGGVRPSEDVFTAAHRELLEETGTSVRNLSILAHFAPSPGLSTSRAVVLLGTHATIVRPPRDTPEIRAVDFASIDSAVARVMASTPSSGGSLLALLLARDVVKSMEW